MTELPFMIGAIFGPFENTQPKMFDYNNSFTIFPMDMCGGYIVETLCSDDFTIILIRFILSCGRCPSGMDTPIDLLIRCVWKKTDRRKVIISVLNICVKLQILFNRLPAFKFAGPSTSFSIYSGLVNTYEAVRCFSPVETLFSYTFIETLMLLELEFGATTYLLKSLHTLPHFNGPNYNNNGFFALCEMGLHEQ